MRHYLMMTGFALFILSSCQFSHEDASRPNILFIMADDHGVGSISSYGSALIETPGIDRLAHEGMKFNNCFSVNSLCAPSRATLITGKHSILNGFMRNGDKFDTAQTTFPSHLQKAGYRTGLIGKWHLGTEPQGFDYYNVLPGQGAHINSRLKEKGLPWENGSRGGIVKEGYVTDVITDLAIDWLNNNKSDKPFFLMVHHKAPHTPHDYAEKYVTLFETEDLPVPETFSDSYISKNPALQFGICGYSRLDNIIPTHIKEKAPEGLNKEEFKHWAYQAFFKGYLRMVASLDQNISRLLDHLDETGLSKNTIVVYTSDNGFFHGDHGLFNKMWMYEESLRIPLLIRFPEVIKPGTVNDNLISMLDFAPTFLDIADAPIPTDLQGKSMKPLLNNKSDEWRDATFYNYFEQYGVPEHYGIRTSKYKLIHFKDTIGNIYGELYDLGSDKIEMQNLYDKPVFDSIKNKLEERLSQMKIEAGHADKGEGVSIR